MDQESLPKRIAHCLGRGLIPIPVEPHTREPLVAPGDDWNSRCEDNERWPAHCDLNWPICLGPNLVTLHFDSIEALYAYYSYPMFFELEVNHG